MCVCVCAISGFTFNFTDFVIDHQLCDEIMMTMVVQLVYNDGGGGCGGGDEYDDYDNDGDDAKKYSFQASWMAHDYLRYLYLYLYLYKLQQPPLSV